MNREERRDLMKKGVSKETINKAEMLNKNCTIMEAIQLAQAASEDVCNIYKRETSSLIMSMTFQIELLKEVVFSNNLITEEEFKAKFEQATKDFESRQKEYIKSMKESANQNTGVVSGSGMEVNLEVVSKE